MSADTRLALGAAFCLAVIVVVFMGMRLGAERFAESEAAKAAEVQR